MHSPELYAATCAPIKGNVVAMLESYKNILRLSKGEKILDVGCGPGSMTTYLSKYLLKDCSIIGCDISEEMVKYAENKYGNGKYSFVQLDIEDPKNEWMNLNKESFDKIFSFTCLHWIENQRQATLNMYNMLKANGQMIIEFLVTHPFIETFKKLPKHPKWKPYLKPWQSWDVELDNRNFTDIDKKNEYMKILSECNFKIVDCTLQENTATFNNPDEFMKIYEAVHPFKRDIPEIKYEEFLADCMDYFRSCERVKFEDEGKVTIMYTSIVTYCEKTR